MLKSIIYRKSITVSHNKVYQKTIKFILATFRFLRILVSSAKYPKRPGCLLKPQKEIKIKQWQIQRTDTDNSWDNFDSEILKLNAKASKMQILKRGVELKLQ